MSTDDRFSDGLFEMNSSSETRLTTQEVADRFGISTAELSELRLANEDLPIERQGFNLFYILQSVRVYEQRETLKVIQHVLASKRPLVMLSHMSTAAGLTNLRIAGRVINAQGSKNIEDRSRLDTVPSVGKSKTREVKNRNDHLPPKIEVDRRQELNGQYPWYVVRTKSRQELVALENLERQGYHCYLPKIRLKKPSVSKLVLDDEPMFPRYLYISVNPFFQSKGSAPIRSTRGVHEMVRFGLEPAQINFEILRAIYERETAQRLQPEHPFKVGDRVKFVHGPFAGLESIYQTQSGEQRSMILLELLNRPLRVQVPTAQLRKTG